MLIKYRSKKYVNFRFEFSKANLEHIKTNWDNLNLAVSLIPIN